MQPFLQVYNLLEQHKHQLRELQEKLIYQLARGFKSSQNVTEENANDEASKINISKKLDNISVSNNTASNSSKVSNHTKFKAFNFDKRLGQKYTMPLCHFDSYNLWILKPTHLNRGRGIHVFRDPESLHKLIK